MMQMVLKTALCATLTLAGTAALAVDHEIRMERYGYFPNTIYVQSGDTITFVNNTPSWAQVYSADSNDNDWGNYNAEAPCSQDPSQFDGPMDGWSIGWFSAGSTRTIDVSSCMETVIYPPYIYQYSYNDQKYRANIIFGTAPNGS